MQREPSTFNELSVKKLAKRIIFAFIAGVSAVLAIVYISNNQVQKFSEINSQLDVALNICAEQQTLSQYLSKNVLLLKDDGTALSKPVINRLDSSLALFQNNHQLLKITNDKLQTYDRVDIAIVDSIYSASNIPLSSLIKSSFGIQEGASIQIFKRNVLIQEETFLPLVNQLTAEYKKLDSMVNESLNQVVSRQYWFIGLTVILAALSVLIFTIQLISIRINSHKNYFYELFDSKKRYENLISHTHDVVYELDGNGHYTFINPAFEKLTQYSLDEANEKRWFEHVHKDYRNEVIEFYISTARTIKRSCYYEFPIVTKTGEVRWIGQTSDFSYDRNGNIALIYNIGKDITDQKIATEKEERYKEGLRLLNELNAKTELSIQERLEDGLKLCLEYLNLEVGIVSKIWMDEYRIAAFYPKSCGLENNQKFKLGDTYCDITLRERGKVLSIDDMNDSAHNGHPCFENFKLESYIGAAYRVGGKVAGTVNFTSTNARRQPFSDYELDFVTLVSKWVGSLMELQESHERLEAERELLKTFISSAPAAIAMFDKHMNYISASEKWLKDQNIKGKVVGKSHYKVFPEISTEWKSMHQRALKGEVIKPGIEKFERADGSVQWLQGEIHPWYTSKDKIGGIIIFINDLTDMKRQEVELRKAKEEAEAAGKVKEQFLSTMSHEIRTPLNAIIGTTQLLEMEHPELSDSNRLKMLKFGSNNLLALINDILDVQKIESGNLDIVEEDVNLKELTENIVETWRAVPRGGDVEVKLNYSPKLGAFYKCDEVRLTQVLNNLISNAVKFTEEGSVELKVDFSKDKRIQFSVSDTGIGIPADKLETIFESFKQINNPQSLKSGGTGLGLSISKRLVDLMDGELKVESKLDKGTTFYFQLPLEVSMVQQDKKARKISDANLELHVLLVEDNIANQEIARGFLNRWGVKVDLANHGKEALQKIKSKAYDLMLIDVRMPVMDGYEATRRIRAMKGDYFKNLPIIALTASTLTESRSKMEDCGMNEIVSKPFDPPDLFEKVSRLGRRETHHSGSENTKDKDSTKGLYFEFLTDVLGGDEEKVMMIANMAVQSINDDLKGSKTTLEAQDRERTYNYLHRMKSNLANLDMRELAGRMPDYKADDFWEELPPYLDEVEVAIEKLQVRLV